MLFKTSAIALFLAVESVMSSSSVYQCIESEFHRHSNGVQNLREAILHVERGSTGEVLYSHDADKTFEVMSVTKAFVGAVFNQLMDEGKIWYLDPFTEYIPADIGVANWCSTGSVDSITIRDLLNHKSGFQDLWDSDPPTKFLEDWTREGRDRVWSPRQVLAYMPTFSNKCGSGEFSYADTNFLVLGIIIEHITGNTLAREIRARILDKVGMTNTFMLHYESPGGAPVKSSCQVQNQNWVGDGWCDNDGGYNTPECNFDGGDCCEYSCDKNSIYKCEKGTSKDIACRVNKPFTNEGDITTLWRSFSADWGGSGYVSTAKDLAKFIKAWYKTPGMLFCPETSRCRVPSEKMQSWDDKNHEGYSMGFEMTYFGEEPFGYGHSGINNSFMFYVGPYGAVITGTLNWYGGGEKDAGKWWDMLHDVMSKCVPLDGDDWLHDCPGKDSEEYFEAYAQCNRACKVWDLALVDWSFEECKKKCMDDVAKGGDARWDDQYVTCLERNEYCLHKRSNILEDRCAGCPNECMQSDQDWWHCIPQCEARPPQNRVSQKLRANSGKPLDIN